MLVLRRCWSDYNWLGTEQSCSIAELVSYYGADELRLALRELSAAGYLTADGGACRLTSAGLARAETDPAVTSQVQQFPIRELRRVIRAALVQAWDYHGPQATVDEARLAQLTRSNRRALRAQLAHLEAEGFIQREGEGLRVTPRGLDIQCWYETAASRR